MLAYWSIISVWNGNVLFWLHVLSSLSNPSLSTSYSQTFINVWFSNLKPHNFWVSRQHCLCHPLRRLIMALHNTTHFFLKPKLKMIAIRFFAEAKYSQVFPFVLPRVPEKMSFLVDFKYASVIFKKRYINLDFFAARYLVKNRFGTSKF